MKTVTENANASWMTLHHVGASLLRTLYQRFMNYDLIEIVRLLIENGLDIEAKNSDGNTPLDILLNNPPIVTDDNTIK